MTPPFDLLPLCSIAFIYSGLDVCLWDLNTYSDDSHPCVDYVDSLNCKSYSPDQVKHILNNNFSLLHLNTRSLQKQYNDLVSLMTITDHGFDVVGCSETWLNERSQNL